MPRPGSVRNHLLIRLTIGVMVTAFLLTSWTSLSGAALPAGPYRVLVVRVDFEDAPGVQFTTSQFRDTWLAELVRWWDDMSNSMLQLEPYFVETTITLGPRRTYYPCNESTVLLPGEECITAIEPAVQQLVGATPPLIDVLAGQGLVPPGSTDPNDVFDAVMVVFSQPLDYPLTVFRGAGCGAWGGISSTRHIKDASGSRFPGGPYGLAIATEDSNQSCDAAFLPWDLKGAVHEIAHIMATHFGNSAAHPSGYKNAFETMDSCATCYLSANTRMSAEAKGPGFDVSFPGWLPDANVAMLDPVGGDGTVVLSPIEMDPDVVTSPQAMRVATADGTIHIVECRRLINWDADQPIWDTGVHIMTSIPGATLATEFRMPPDGTPFDWTDPDRRALWKDGMIFFDIANDIALFIGPDSGDGCVVTVEYGALSAAAVPDVGIIPWRTPPLNTWETIDIWVDSPCNGYEDEGGLLRYGRDVDGNVVGNGDDVCANRKNRVYAKIRNFGTQDAFDVTGRIRRTDPLGVGVRGSTGWVDIGTFGPIPVIPRNADVTVFVDWTPVVTPPVPDGEVFPFHSCLQLIVDAVPGERLLANQDGDREQENISTFEVRRDPIGDAYALATDEIILANDLNEAADYFVTATSDLPADWIFDFTALDGTFHLLPGESVVLPISVQAPDGAPLGQTYSVKVEGFRREDFVFPDTGELHTDMHLVAGALLSAQTVIDTSVSVAGAGSPPASCNAAMLSMSGCLSMPVAGTIVSLDAYAPDGSVLSVLATTDSGGCFSESVPISTTGDWEVQAFWHGDAMNGSARSARMPVPVYDPTDVDCDQIPDVSDNCLKVPNPQQADADQDGFGDKCDCNSLDAGAWVQPPEVANVQFLVDQSTLQWDSLAPVAGWSTLYDVTKGLLSELPTGSGPSETCLAEQTQGTTLVDTFIPKIGDGAWYFVQPVNSCGHGSPGTGPGGVPRGTAACGVCSHDICTQGAALDPSCGQCAAQICDADSFCCTDLWDAICVGEVSSVCGSAECGGN